MIVNVIISKNEDRVIETIYEQFESEKIRKCICEYNCPWNNKGGIVNFKFYDKNDQEVNLFNLPQGTSYNLIIGIPIFSNGDCIILPGWKKYETTCFSLKSNSVVWKSAVEKVTDIFIYNDKIYCSWSTSKGGLTLISAKTGEIINQVLKYNFDIQCPYIKRLNERYLAIYIKSFIFIYDMEKENLLLTSVRISEPPSKDYYKLKSIIHKLNTDEVIFNFSDIDIEKGDVISINKCAQMSKLINTAKISNFKKAIPTDTKDLEEEYNHLFKSL